MSRTSRTTNTYERRAKRLEAEIETIAGQGSAPAVPQPQKL